SHQDYAQAEPLCTEALEVRRRVLGEEHPDTVQSMQILATMYRGQGKYAAAETLYGKVLTSRRRLLGKDHPETLNSLTGLGAVQFAQGKYAAAEVSCREAVSAYQRKLPEAWEGYFNQSLLGAILAAQKRYAEAEPLLISGYEGLIQRRATILPDRQSAPQEA